MHVFLVSVCLFGSEELDTPDKVISIGIASSVEKVLELVGDKRHPSLFENHKDAPFQLPREEGSIYMVEPVHVDHFKDHLV